MANTKFYLDKRVLRKGGVAPLKIAIAHNCATAFLNLNVSILPEQWDVLGDKIINHPNKQFLNTYILRRKLDVETLLIRLIESGEIYAMNAKEVRDYISEKLSPEKERERHQKRKFIFRLRKFIEGKTNGRTREIYQMTLNKIISFADNPETLNFEDITKEWLTKFEVFLSTTAPSKNARNIHLRNIRAVFNDAMDDDITHFYPFRKFKIKNVATIKRSLTINQLQQLFNYPCEEYLEQYRDVFKLIFYLIGINIIDLCNLKNIRDGRIEYYRAKTNRLYSVKVEPEALELIEKYRGENFLLNILDRYADYKDYAKRLNDNLRLIGEVWTDKHGKKIRNPIFPSITTYWARHTWATIAASLDIPKETIAAGLGHGRDTVTDIYIDFDRQKVDNANRKVIDYVNRVCAGNFVPPLSPP